VVAIGCGEAARQLQERKDGRLGPASSAALDAHFATCDPCRRQAHLLDWIGDVMENHRRAAPPGFADRVLRSVAGRTPAAVLVRRQAPMPYLAGWRLVPAAAGVALVAALLAMALLRPSVPHVPAAPAAPIASTEPRVRVELELAKADARSVAVAGDFNEWQIDASKMTRGADGVWRIRLELPPGRYQYVFVIDDDRWMADPRASTVVDSGFSGTNSVLDVSL
jgi:hypothetical protein